MSRLAGTAAERADLVLAELQRTAATSMPLAQLRSTVSRLSALEFETSELEAELATTAEAARADEPGDVPPRPMAWLSAAAILVVLGWAAMFLLRDAGLVGVAIVAVIAVGVAVALVQAARLGGGRRR